MRNIALILSLFFLPTMYSEGKGRVNIEPGKNLKRFGSMERRSLNIGKKNHTLLPFTGCNGVCVENLAQNVPLAVDVKQTLDEEISILSGADLIKVSTVANKLPTVAIELSQRLETPQEAKDTAAALLTAAVDSANWRNAHGELDVEAQENIIRVVDQVINGNADPSHLADIRNNCDSTILL